MATVFRYLSLGDSTAVGFGAEPGLGYVDRTWQRLRAAGVNAGLLNLGVNGATVSDVATRQLARKVNAVELVTVGVGSNDLWRMTSAEDFARHFATLGERLEPLGATVLVSNLIDLGNAPVAKWALTSLGVSAELISERVRELNRLIAAEVQRRGFTLVDLHALGEQELGQNRDYFSADGFHPSAKGYARWGELLWPHVAPLLPAASPSESG